MSALVDENTVIVVGSAPQYPQGVIDPIPELAALAGSVGASMHVDACMGGFVLPFMEMNGIELPPWDFRVDGVTTISADIHKLGYAPKGASVLVHRTKELRRYQTFVFDDWLGGFYASPSMQGTLSGLPMATAWAVMHHLGIDGYRRLTAVTIETANRMREGCAQSRACRCWAHRTHTFSPSPPMPDARIRSTPSRSETRCSNAVGSTTARPHPTRCT